MDENLLKELERSYSQDERVLNLIDAYKSILYSEKKITKKTYNIQKMETVANGILHDFNNILMGIQGNVSLLLLKNEFQPSIVSRIDKINNLLNSGKELTGQMLSYTEESSDV